MEVSISDPKLKILWCLTQTVGYFCEKRRKQAVPFFWVEIYIVKFVDVQQDIPCPTAPLAYFPAKPEEKLEEFHANPFVSGDEC